VKHWDGGGTIKGKTPSNKEDFAPDWSNPAMISREMMRRCGIIQPLLTAKMEIGTAGVSRSQGASGTINE
jgi:hypothetical protein